MSREQDLRDAVDRFLARVRTDTDARLEGLAAELLERVRGDPRASRLDLEQAAVDVARAVAMGGSPARHDLATRVVTAVRRLDDATSLRAILDALADSLVGETSRAAVLVATGPAIRPYRHHGFSPHETPVELTIDASPIVAAAVRFRQITAIPACERPDPSVPAFMRVARGHLGVLMPMAVGAEVAALVYAEAATGAAGGHVEGGWAEHVEVLVRHAAQRLENVTSHRTAELAGQA